MTPNEMTVAVSLSLFLVALRAGHAAAAACGSAEPLVFPITDIQVDPTVRDSFMKGIPAKIGNPPQSIVMLPWSDLNNTYIYDEQSDCDPSIIFNDEICKVRRGGPFIETASTSFSKATDLIAAGGASQEITTPGTEIGVRKLVLSSLAGNEQITLGSSNSTTLPIGIPRLRWDNGYTTLHALGLGSNSTYLNALVRAGQIPSRAWSLFWGRMWTDVGGMDGSLVLGGYDREKVIGRNFTQTLDYSEETGCWTGMKVTVANVFVNFRNGTDVGIMPRNGAIQCCIVPHRQLLWEAPSGIIGAFENATQLKSSDVSFGLHWGARIFNASSSLFDGDVSFLLSNGLQVRVPNNQFLTPFVDVARSGSRVIDKSKRELLMTGLADQPATLGRYFFTAAYLMVDQDAKTFTMWQGNPSSKVDLVPVSRNPSGDCGGGPIAGGGPGPGLGAGSAPAEPPSSPIGSGVIAGAVVGGLVVLAVIFMLVWFFRRRKAGSNASGVESHQKKPNQFEAGVPHPPFIPQEVHGTNLYQNHGNAVELRADEHTGASAYLGAKDWKSKNKERERSLYELY